MQRENRRLAAIVAADVAGYSRLIGQDEEGTLRAFRAHRSELIDRLIEQHGGRIANTAVEACQAQFGRLDILVNNAGVIELIGRLSLSNPADWA